MTDQQMALLDRLFEEGCTIPEPERQAWLAGSCGDPEVRAELESLLPHAAATGGFTSALDAAAAIGPPSPLGAGQMIGPYRIVGMLGEGGMGAVYEGVRDDDQFRQRVAIKVLRMSARSEEARRRFLQERQILAEFEHPNIARLFDGGSAVDGSPYIVMERVDGEPLIAFANSRKLSIRQRLELFRQVANAVQYAHQKLIVHRDLKPGNILVTADGMPKLLDFGIAKLLDAETAGGEALTATGFPLMTPDYASPEQVQGKLVTVASDVYSLGAVLYELLTGVRPHNLKTYDPAEIAELICVSEVAPPSSVGGPALRGDLDTIVLKAMQKFPERRYNSAVQFSDDVHRYLEGMPVMARPDTTGYRMRKFAGRHWVGLGATAAVIAALSVGVVVSLYQARLARERFELVRTLANRFLFDFHGEIANLSGSTKAQQMVVNTAVEYLDKLSATAGSDRALLEDMAEAYGKLASVQGGSTTSNTARYEDALVSQRRSVEFYRKLASIDPSKRAKLAVSLIDLSRIEQFLLQEAAGLEHATEGAAILDGLLAAGSKDAKLLGQSAGAYLYVSRSLFNSGKLAEALPANLKAQRYYERALQVRTTPGMQYNLAITQLVEGQMYTISGDVEKGIAVLERCLRTIEKIVAAEPRNRMYQRALISQMDSLATAYYSAERINAGDPRMAETFLKMRRELSQKLLESDPADAVAQMDMASAESSSAEALAEIDPVRAVEFARSAMARWNALPADGPFVPTNRFRAARRLAAALLGSGRTREAVGRSREAVGAIRELMAKRPNEDGYQRLAVLALTTAGQAFAAAGQDSDAHAAYQEAASLGEKLLATESGIPTLTLVAAYGFDHYGSYWKSRGDREQARHWFERSRQAWAARTEHTPAVEQKRKLAEERLNGL